MAKPFDINNVPPEKLAQAYIGKQADVAGKFGKWFGNSDFGKRFRAQLGMTIDVLAKPIEDILGGHAQLLDQLRLHAKYPDIGKHVELYESLGTELPGVPFVGEIQRSLLKVAHSDHGGTDEAASAINAACGALKNEQSRAAYNVVRDKAPKVLQDAFERSVKTTATWHPAVPYTPHSRLPAPIGEQVAHAEKLSEKFRAIPKPALVFAGVAVVGVGAYLLAKQFAHKQPEQIDTIAAR